MVIMVLNKAYIPICSLSNKKWVSMKNPANAKRNREKRWKSVNNMEVIQKVDVKKGFNDI